MGFSSNEYWCELPLSPPGHLPDPRINLPSLMSSALAGGLFTTSAFWQALILMFKFVDLINLYVCVCVYTHTHTYIYKAVYVYQFSSSSVAELCPTLCTPWTAAWQAPMSITNFWSLLKLMSIESLMPSNHLILCHSLLLLTSIFPSFRVF